MSNPVPDDGRKRVEYKPLRGSEIRLLRVMPGAWDDQVSCTIHHVPLDERPEYVALSYTWGNPSDQVDILVDGRQHRATRSLFTALRRFRQLCAEGRSYDGFTFSLSATDGTTYIWADALCINQGDEREKEREIPRMRDVYTLCERVCVWLGNNDESWDNDADTKALLEKIERWLESGSFGADISHKLEHMSIEDTLPTEQEVEDYFSPRVDAFLDLWRQIGSHAWFCRGWVVQEVALSEAEPILMVGGYLLGFERFTRLHDVISTMRHGMYGVGTDYDLVAHKGLLETRAWAQSNPIQINEGAEEDRAARFGRMFEEVMERQGPAGFETTVPHDFLYSMIGLCGGGELLPPELAPNYQRPFPRVCEDYARCIVKATGSVGILGRTFSKLLDEYPEALADRLPVWVPDFRASNWSISVEGDVDPSNVSFGGPDGRRLKVRGYDSRKVIRVYTPLADKADDDSHSFSEHLRHHHKFLEEVARELDVCPEEAVENWLDLKILVLDGGSWATKPTIEDLQALYNRYLQQNDGGDNSCIDSLQDSETAKRFVQIARDNIIDRGRAKVLCEGGTVAQLMRLYGEPPRRGDCLVALSGGAFPFLLRPVTFDFGVAYEDLGFCVSSHGASMLRYTADDYSLEYYDESEFEHFLLI